MDKSALSAALSGILEPALAEELASDFLLLRHDAATRTLGGASPGKFVETFVQCLQWISTGKYASKPSVDTYLSKVAETQTALPEGLRICAPRIARMIYTLRNKRNIAHKNPVDANTHDLATVHQGAVWIMSELLREASGITMEQAGRLIQRIQAPLGTLVEEIDGVRLVHANIPVRIEILILLHSHYPDKMKVNALLESMKATNPKSVKSRLGELARVKMIHGDSGHGYRLTQAGYDEAVHQITRLVCD